MSEEKMDFSMFMDDFLQDAEDCFEELGKAIAELNRDMNQIEMWEEARRAFHTVKGNSRMLEFWDISELAMSSQNYLDKIRDKELKATTDTLEFLSDVKEALEGMVDERANKRNPRLSEEMTSHSMHLLGWLEATMDRG